LSLSRVAFAGVGATPIARDLPGPLLDACASVIREALEDAQIPASEVDGLFTSPAAMSGEDWMMFAATLGEFLGMPTRSLATYENGGITALLALRAACDAVLLGRVKVAVVLATDSRPTLDVTRFESFMRGAAYRSGSLYGPFVGALGVGTPIPIYAMSHQRYMHEFGADERQLAEVSVALRRHAAEHPLAQFREAITVDDVLGSKMLSPPIHLLQAAGLSSGVCAVVVTKAEDARDTGRPVVTLAGYGEHHHPSHFVPRRGSLTRFESVQKAAAQALDEAGRTIDDVDVAEVYGVFAATELILYEDLGFCEKGQGAAFLAEGRATLGGDVLINPTGGRICAGHPAGATPLYEVAEIVRQLRGEAPGIQARDPELGLVHAEHGMMNGSIVLALDRSG
jgi:acetyl-CoA C-acetyltransferase